VHQAPKNASLRDKLEKRIVSAPSTAIAKQFADAGTAFLASPEAREILKQFGYIEP
jgi:hypothetical protein